MMGLVSEDQFCRNAALSDGGEGLHVIVFNWALLEAVGWCLRAGLLAALSIKKKMSNCLIFINWNTDLIAKVQTMQEINSLSGLKTQLLPFTRALLSQHLNKHMSQLTLYYPFKIDFWHLFL